MRLSTSKAGAGALRLRDGVKSGLRRRYAGSLLGPAWAIIYPIALLGIYATLYAFVFKVRVPGLDMWNYIIMVFAGLVPLLAFSEMLNASTSSISANREVVLNRAFPVQLIPVRDALVAQAPSVVGVVATLIAAAILGDTSPLPLALLPFLWVALVAFSVGIGLILSLVALVTKDLQYILGLAIMVLFISSPFAYTPEMVPAALKPLIMINPLTYFVLSFQDVIAFGRLPDWPQLLIVVLLSVASLALGWHFFTKARRVFFDYV